MQSDPDVTQLARLTLAHQNGTTVFSHDALNSVIAALDRETHDKLLDLPGRDEVTDKDVLAGLRLLHRERDFLDLQERELIEAAKDRGVTWERLGAEAADNTYVVHPKTLSAQAMQQRYKRLGGTRSWPTSQPRRARRNDPGADPQPTAVTITYSVRTANDDGWDEVVREPHPEAAAILAMVADDRITVLAKKCGITPGEDVKVAVLDEAGKQIDAFTTTAQ